MAKSYTFDLVFIGYGLKTGQGFNPGPSLARSALCPLASASALRSKFKTIDRDRVYSCSTAWDEEGHIVSIPGKTRSLTGS
jgi:hypothetical protein